VSVIALVMAEFVWIWDIRYGTSELANGEKRYGYRQAGVTGYPEEYTRRVGWLVSIITGCGVRGLTRVGNALRFTA
jgi:hypothetical protein